MKIGIFGGTFDPIHNAHLIIAQYAKEQFGLDRMILMPGGNPPHKQNVTDKKVRLEMAILAADGDFEVSDYETKKEEYSYTLNTLTYFKERYPEDELFFVIGEDSLRDITKWYYPEKILKLCTLLVFPRISEESLKSEIESKKSFFGCVIYPISAPVLNISSSEVRYRTANGKSIKHMLPENVRKFIEEKRLYKNE